MAKKFQRRALTGQELANIEAWFSEGYTYKQIGRKLNRTTSAIRNLVKRIVSPGLYRNVGSTGKLTEVDFSSVSAQSFRDVGAKPRALTKSEFSLSTPKQTTDDLIKLIAALPTDAETKLKLFKSL